MTSPAEPLTVVDLFCGGGGSSTGIAEACRELGCKIELLAINHWPEAVATHQANHPWARHECVAVEDAHPTELVPGGRVGLLFASPECMGHSKAAGGKPKNEQRRASAWYPLRWADLLRVDNIIIENVGEIRKWGPLDPEGYPIKERAGETFDAWVNVIRSMGYNVEYRILNAADYGAATSRSRFFLIGRKWDQPIVWPEPTHNKDGGNGKEKWPAARTIIDQNLKGKSIFTRKKPLSDKTLARVFEGIFRFGGAPFLHLMEHGGSIRGLDMPIFTITANKKGGTMAYVDPFILSQGSGGAPRSTADPVPTIPGSGAHSLVECIIPNFGEREGQRPRCHSVDAPLSAVTGRGAGNLVQFILPVQGYFHKEGQNAAKSTDIPLGTITQRGGGSLVECLVQYNGQSRAQSIEDPLGTLTTRERFAFVQAAANEWGFDILYRMLQPHELAAATGFPKGYVFMGKKKDRIMQIGNAVVVPMAKALAKSLLRGRSR